MVQSLTLWSGSRCEFKYKMRSSPSFEIQPKVWRIWRIWRIWYKILDRYRKIDSDTLEDGFQYIGGCNKTSWSAGIEGWEPFAAPRAVPRILTTSAPDRAWDLIDPRNTWQCRCGTLPILAFKWNETKKIQSTWRRCWRNTFGFKCGFLNVKGGKAKKWPLSVDWIWLFDLSGETARWHRKRATTKPTPP